MRVALCESISERGAMVQDRVRSRIFWDDVPGVKSSMLTVSKTLREIVRWMSARPGRHGMLPNFDIADSWSHKGRRCSSCHRCIV